jgi:hypothetical protein
LSQFSNGKGWHSRNVNDPVGLLQSLNHVLHGLRRRDPEARHFRIGHLDRFPARNGVFPNLDHAAVALQHIPIPDQGVLGLEPASGIFLENLLHQILGGAVGIYRMAGLVGGDAQHMLHACQHGQLTDVQ